MDMELNLFKYHKFSSELFWLAWKMIHNQTNLLTRSERDHYVHKEEGMREQMFLGKKEKFDMTVVGDIGRVLRGIHMRDYKRVTCFMSWFIELFY